MALQISTITPDGFTAGEAYVRIVKISGGKSGYKLQVEFFKDADCASGMCLSFKKKSYMIDYSEEDDIFTIGYNALKQLDEFDGALDV